MRTDRSLFIRLLLSFLTIIIIMFAFSVFAIHFFSVKFREQLIHSNTLNLDNIVDGYESRLRQLDNLLTSYFFDNAVTVLNEGNLRTDYPIVQQLAQELNTVVSHYNLDLDNILIYFKEPGFIIDKYGFSHEEDTFRNYYAHPDYSMDFWETQRLEDFHFRVYPAAHFTSAPRTPRAPPGALLPVVVKSQTNSHLYLIAFVNADRMFANVHNTASQPFYIMDDSGNLIFRSDARSDFRLPDLPSDRTYAMRDNNYYFYAKNNRSSLTYVSMIPNHRFAEQLTQMNLILSFLFAFSVLFCVVVSIILSMKFRSPVQQIIKSLQQMNPSVQHRSTIQEFNAISESLNKIITEYRHKNSLLTKYGYIDKIKSIPADSDVIHLTRTDRPFHFILYKIHYSYTYEHIGSSQQPKSTYFLEFINLNMLQVSPDALTILVDNDVILSIVFSDHERSESLLNKLHYIKKIFDIDKEHYQLTIACQQKLWKPDEFVLAYKSTNTMLKQRKLNGETQIIIYETETGDNALFWTPEEERRFMANLQAGNADPLLAIVDCALQRFGKHDVPAWQYRQYAEEVLSKLLSTLMAYKIDTNSLPIGASPFEEIESCVHEAQFIDFFHRMIGRATELIREKRQARDPIVDYIISFIEQHFGDDIYQDLIAERLNISTGYMRNYFKEKTGQNLTDYLNEYRINKAKEMLETSVEKIQDIAARVGYQNANSFTRMFRRLTGVTPGEYRRDKHLAN